MLETALASWQKFTEATFSQMPGFPTPPLPFLGPLNAASAFSQFFSPPLVSDPFPKGLFPSDSLWPGILHNLATPWWTGYFTLQRLWMEHLAKVPPDLQFAQVKRLDRDFFKNCLAAYEQTWQPLLKIPQLGLTREYQENVAQLVDKFQIFQAALADFLFCLYQPVEESLATLQEHLQAQAQQDQLSEDFQVYYRMWIKTLEGLYQKLFTEPEFLQTMKKALAAMNDFLAARHEVVTATLKNLFIPTHEELDELYQEIYQVKKTLRELKSGHIRKRTTRRSPSSE